MIASRAASRSFVQLPRTKRFASSPAAVGHLWRRTRDSRAASPRRPVSFVTGNALSLPDNSADDKSSQGALAPSWRHAT
ncbi:hypothetical protein I41_36460 [Lacipirellula limnantheis]|uniref:Uncharacterized protein n=1 Tax=Lacipirellula limnantheis TaxID=2528024 RepID=A0A517U1E9_9BACT|nr:hypothetical protein I41_36460 [Lacipirellula limnantheis]